MISDIILDQRSMLNYVYVMFANYLINICSHIRALANLGCQLENELK